MSKVVTESADATTKQATLEVQRFLRTPSVLGESLEHALRTGYIDLNDRDSITRFIYELSKRNADYGVSGAYLANLESDLVGIDADLQDGVEQWSVLHASARTDGKLNEYSVNEDGSAAELLVVGATYNATWRPWYKQAIASTNTVWTDIYQDASSGKPVLTWANAIRNSEGELIAVIGVDLLVSRINQFLEQLSTSEHSTLLLTDRRGKLIGNGLVQPDQPSQLATQLKPGQLLRYLNEQHSGIASIQEVLKAQVVIEGRRGLIKVVPLIENVKLAWSVGVFVPMSDYLSSLSEQLVGIIPLILFTVFIVWVALQMFLRLIVKPLLNLENAANQIASGQFDVLIATEDSNEVGELAKSIDSMRLRLKRAFKDLDEQKVRAETTLASITDGVITVGLEGNVRYMNRAALSQCGLSANEVMDKPLENIFYASELISGESFTSDSIKSVIKDGAPCDCNLKMLDVAGIHRIIECRICPLLSEPGSAATGAVLVFSDVTEQVVLKTELERQASIDELTGLMNRRQFEAHLESTVASVAGTKNTHCLCFMDLDQFKIVNDTCGHVSGDELLRQIGQLLRNLVRQGDAVARLGGDEFAMLLDRCAVEEGARVMEKLLTSINDYRFIWEDRVFTIGISIGLVAIDKQITNATALLADADMACYTAKNSGRNRIHIYRPDDIELTDRREESRLVNEIDSALINERFELYTQEIRSIDGDSDRAARFEVLVRMHSADGSLVPPDRFLPTAERFDLATKIDHWVVMAILNFFEQNPAVLPMVKQCSINLSAQSLGDEQFLVWLPKYLDSTSVPKRKLCFEVTEASAIANLNNAIALISALHSRGCSLTLDGFGSVFFSLTYLKTLPFDYLKIDRKIVAGINNDEHALAMVKLINDIGKTMGMKTIAEFVESKSIHQRLKKLGVEFVQGYAIDIPQPINRLIVQPDSDDSQVLNTG